MKSKNAQSKTVESTLLRFDGILYENNTFQPNIGWETDRAGHRHETGDGLYSLQLLDKEGEELLSSSPAVDFQGGCARVADQLRSTRIVAYLPMHPEAAKISLNYKERVIYEAPIAESAPAVESISVKYNRKSLSAELTWKSAGDKKSPAKVRAFYFTSTQRGFPISKWRADKGKLSVKLDNVPADDAAQIGLLISDGVRSSKVVSEPFKTRDQGPKIMIVSPENGRVYAHGQPIDLLGQTLDAASTPFEFEQTQWKLNGDAICMKHSEGLLKDLEPGKYEVSLETKTSPRKRYSQKVQFTVAEPCKKHAEAFATLVKKINASAVLEPTVHEGFTPILQTPSHTIKRKCNCH